jgi:uncharacterized protein (TIGR03437 family)
MKNSGWTFYRSSSVLKTALLFLLVSSTGYSQLSSSAYRVLGQPSLQQNGLNMVQGTELNSPSGLALDNRGGQTHLYISDTRNSRILAWADVSSYQTGDAPAVILAQPGPQYTSPLGIGNKGLTSPLGIAVDAGTGNLYVADYGNNRVLRFPSPFLNPTRIEPDAVYGQPGFNSRTAATTDSLLNQPRAVAFDLTGNLWVADSGNHRIVRFSAATLNSPIPPAADAVIGQADLFSGAADTGGAVSATGLDTPTSIVFDSSNNLYVSDFGNARVLRFPAPLGPSSKNPAASSVWGQVNFTSKSVPAQPSASSLTGPVGLALDNSGNLYVAVPFDNRVLTFSATSPGPAKNILGQSDFTTRTANTGFTPLTSPGTLSAPSDVKVDQNGNVFIADSGNNRVIAVPANSKSANRVWGQSDFTSNGPNQIKPSSVNFPYKMAIDYSSAPFALYLSDTANNRVLIWKDSVNFRSGDPADMVIGQPSLRTAAANVDTQGSTNPSATSLSNPEGIVLDARGMLYVADAGNNRVLRFPRPVNQSGRIKPDAVIGQTDFVSSASAAVSASSLSSPGGVALGPNGNIFVADAGNNRILEFASGAGTGATAVRVYGQPNMNTAARPSRVSAQTLLSPQGIAVDPASNLYVADTGANRVLVFINTQSAPPLGVGATFVLGQSGFASSDSGALKSPSDVVTDSNGNIYVADEGNNRVLLYPSLVFLPVAGATATAVVGQQGLTGTSSNYNSTNGLATAEGLYSPVGLYLDRQDTLYVGDAGNNRVVQFLKPAAVLNGATFQTSVPVAPRSLVTLFSAGLTANTATASGTTWPATLANRQVVINDQANAPLYFINSTQVNFQVPTSIPIGAVRIAVRTADTGELIAGGSLLTAAASPGLFTSSQSGSGQAAASNQDGSINSAANPAAIGSTITLYGTGQGQVSPEVPDGTAAPGPPGLSNTVAVPTSDSKTCLNNQPSMCVTVGASGFGNVQYSGLAPGYIGLWQINVTIPQGTPTGSVPVRVLIDGTPGNTVTIAVR